MQSPILAVEKLRKSYSEKIVLNELSFSLKANEIVGFVGKNGSGKTTTIRVLLNLLQKDGGTIKFRGQDTAGGITYLRCIGYIQQTGGLIEDFSLRENLAFFAGLHGFDSSEFNERIAEYLEKFNMKDLENSVVKTFSQGMKQKVKIIKGLIHDPDLLILDEPLTGLDPWERGNAITVLKTFAKCNCKTVFLSSHILSDLQKIADRIILLEAGKIKGDFAAEDVPTDNTLFLQEK